MQTAFVQTPHIATNDHTLHARRSGCNESTAYSLGPLEINSLGSAAYVRDRILPINQFLIHSTEALKSHRPQKYAMQLKSKRPEIMTSRYFVVQQQQPASVD